MSYVEKRVLQKEEKVIERVEIHPFSLIVMWVFGILFFWLLFIPTYYAIRETIYYKNTEYYVTNKRLIEKYGLFSVCCDEMQLDKIENITVNVSFFGRLLGYGSISIQGANRNNINFNRVKNPERVRTLIDSAIND